MCKYYVQCNNCLKSRVDITEGLPREGSIQRCRGCGRYLDPPKRWVACESETRELMAVSLLRHKALTTVKPSVASFLWAETHSRPSTATTPLRTLAELLTADQPDLFTVHYDAYY